jgi:hypothetical protein
LWKEISKTAEVGKEHRQNRKKTRKNCRNIKKKNGEEKES